MKNIGKAIKATHEYWGGTSESCGFLFEIEFSISNINSQSTYTTGEGSRKEAEHSVYFQEKTTLWSINGIEMPALLYQSWMHKNNNIHYMLVDAVREFFQNKISNCDSSQFNGNWSNTTGKLEKMLESIPAFDEQLGNGAPRVIEYTHNKETLSGKVCIVSRKDF